MGKEVDRFRKAQRFERVVFTLLLVLIGGAGYLYERYRFEMPARTLITAIIAYLCGCYLVYRVALRFLMPDQRTTALYVARTIRAFLDGSGGARDWDIFTSSSFSDPELDSIRHRAGTVELPVGPEEVFLLKELQDEAEKLAGE